MNHKTLFNVLPILGLVLTVGVLLIGLQGAVGAQGPEPPGEVGALANLGTAITYQGHLNDGGSPANGNYDFEFRLYDAASGGSQVGSTVTIDDVIVIDGFFAVELDRRAAGEQHRRLHAPKPAPSPHRRAICPQPEARGECQRRGAWQWVVWQPSAWSIQYFDELWCPWDYGLH
jgi:hypothetical protein